MTVVFCSAHARTQERRCRSRSDVEKAQPRARPPTEVAVAIVPLVLPWKVLPHLNWTFCSDFLVFPLQRPQFSSQLDLFSMLSLAATRGFEKNVCANLRSEIYQLSSKFSSPSGWWRRSRYNFGTAVA
jgi:hypothetical protein